MRVTATELTLWDLSTSDNAVLAAFQVRVDDGSLTRLNFKVPAGLDATELRFRVGVVLPDAACQKLAHPAQILENGAA